MLQLPHAEQLLSLTGSYTALLEIVVLRIALGHFKAVKIRHQSSFYQKCFWSVSFSKLFLFSSASSWVWNLKQWNSICGLFCKFLLPSDGCSDRAALGVHWFYCVKLVQHEGFKPLFLLLKWTLSKYKQIHELLFMPSLSQVVICICVKEMKRKYSYLVKRKRRKNKGF